MTSPPIGRVVLQVRKHTVACVAALVTCLTAVSPAAAQNTGNAADSAADSAGPDSAAAQPADTTARPDSAPLGPGDTLAPAPRDSAAPRGPPAPPPVPVDSALGAACKGSSGNPADLLLVSFRPTATEQERDAVAREVDGKVVGAAQVGPPATYYIDVPGGASDRAVADRIIRLEPVVQVGTARCPS